MTDEQPPEPVQELLRKRSGKEAGSAGPGQGDPQESSNAKETEAWERLSDRDRYRIYFDEAAAANCTMPVFTLAFITIVLGLIWFAVFWYLVRDAEQDLFSELNMRKFVLYNVLHGVLGFGASSGPLGAKFKVPWGLPFLMFLTPGTLCSPLFPGVVSLVQRTPAKRSLLQVLLSGAYMMSLVYAIVDPSIMRVTIVNLLLAAATVSDFTVFLASRGEHYGYMMISMSFPDWIAGCQWVQLMLWLAVGVSKCGPWFKYVIQVLIKDAIWTPFLPDKFSANLLNKDFEKGDFTPSVAARVLAACGALGEWTFPLCAVLGPPGSAINTFGVFGMMAYHTFIWSTLPFASVFEWQYYTIFMTYFLYRLHPFAVPTSPLLLVFLIFVLFVLPVVGQLRPTLVPFLLAYRQYAGNWRMGTVMLRKGARAKFDKLKTYESIYHWEHAPEGMGGERTSYMTGAPFMVVPQFRGQFSILEAFFKKTGGREDDFYFIGTFMFVNAVNGWNLGGGWEFNRECWRKAVVEVCGLAPGDMYSLMMEPVENLPPHNLSYRLMDMTKGPLDAEVYANVPYEELEGTHPMEVHIKEERIKSGNSIKGMFLDTYYI